VCSRLVESPCCGAVKMAAQGHCEDRRAGAVKIAVLVL
jgi:hypothetical protein